MKIAGIQFEEVGRRDLLDMTGSNAQQRLETGSPPAGCNYTTGTGPTNAMELWEPTLQIGRPPQRESEEANCPRQPATPFRDDETGIMLDCYSSLLGPNPSPGATQGPIAQPVEQRFCKPQVAGSKPAGASTISR